MRHLLFAAPAALLMSGLVAYADDMTQDRDQHIQAIGSHAGLAVADVGYVPPEVVAAQRLATERRLKQLAASRSVADVGFVPPEFRAPQRQERSSAGGPVADVGYVPPAYLAAQRLALLREEQRLVRRVAALRQARRSFYRPVADVGYVPPEVVAAQRGAGGEDMIASAQDATFAFSMAAPAAKDGECLDQ